MSKIYYSPSHEYIRVEEDGTGFIGISDFAQHQLGNVVYVDMPEEGDEITAGEDFGAIESVKAASDLIAPVSGTVVAVNKALEENPRLVNEDAMSNWIIKIEIADPEDLNSLLDEAAYKTLCGNEH